MSGRTARPNPSSQPLLQQPSGPYSRAPPDTSVRYGDPHRRPPANSQRSYYDIAPSEKRGYSQGQSRQEPSDQGKRLNLVKLEQKDFPDFIFGNLVAVSPSDYHPSQVNSILYIMLKNLCVCTAKTHPSIEQGQIGIPRVQREWADMSITDTSVEAEKYDPFQEDGPRFLGSVTVVASFTKLANMTETAYDQDKLQERFTKVVG